MSLFWKFKYFWDVCLYTAVLLCHKYLGLGYTGIYCTMCAIHLKYNVVVTFVRQIYVLKWITFTCHIKERSQFISEMSDSTVCPTLQAHCVLGIKCKIQNFDQRLRAHLKGKMICLVGVFLKCRRWKGIPSTSMCFEFLSGNAAGWWVPAPQPVTELRVNHQTVCIYLSHRPPVSTYLSCWSQCGQSVHEL